MIKKDHLTSGNLTSYLRREYVSLRAAVDITFITGGFVTYIDGGNDYLH